MMFKTALLDFVHRANYKIIKLKHFGNWVLLPSSSEKGRKRRHKTYLLGPLVQLASRCKTSSNRGPNRQVLCPLYPLFS
jgi:hypothetical protein